MTPEERLRDVCSRFALYGDRDLGSAVSFLTGFDVGSEGSVLGRPFSRWLFETCGAPENLTWSAAVRDVVADQVAQQRLSGDGEPDEVVVLMSVVLAFLDRSLPEDTLRGPGAFDARPAGRSGITGPVVLDEGTTREAGRRLIGIIDAILEDVDGPVRLCDLLDVLALSVPGLGEGLDALPDQLPLDVVLSAGERHRCTETLAVHEVGDHVFAEAVAFMAWLTAAAARPDGDPVDAHWLAGAVLAAVRGAGVDLADVDLLSVVALEPAVVAPRARLRAGDVVAIPSDAGPPFLAVVLVPRCSAGTALGLLLDRGGLAGTGRAVDVPAMLRRPVFTDDRLVGEGRWTVVAHDEGLLSRFPREPEIYHRPDPVLERLGLRLGPFGAAEPVSGGHRYLEEAEAREIGLLDRGFRQTYDGEGLQRLLDGLVRAPEHEGAP